jgi:hypothetical protein
MCRIDLMLITRRKANPYRKIEYTAGRQHHDWRYDATAAVAFHQEWDHEHGQCKYQRRFPRKKRKSAGQHRGHCAALDKSDHEKRTGQPTSTDRHRPDHGAREIEPPGENPKQSKRIEDVVPRQLLSQITGENSEAQATATLSTIAIQSFSVSFSPRSAAIALSKSFPMAARPARRYFHCGIISLTPPSRASTSMLPTLRFAENV